MDFILLIIILIVGGIGFLGILYGILSNNNINTDTKPQTNDAQMEDVQEAQSDEPEKQEDDTQDVEQKQDVQPTNDEPSSETYNLIELSETDGNKNTELLNIALKNGDVKLKCGNYPFAPGVVIDGSTLDLNGSTLTSTELRYVGANVVMVGDSPCICNGTLKGNYSKAPNENGYVSFEQESAIRLPDGGYTNALIDNVSMCNFCGYAICNGGDAKNGITYSIRHFSSKNRPVDNREKYNLSGVHSYVTARHAIGYNYYISDTPVKYEFENANGQSISCEFGTPGESIKVPDGAVAVWVSTFIDEYKQHGLFEYLYDNSLTINRCSFICNQRLGIANLAGNSVVSNCISKSNGYPREDHSDINRWDSSTSGFIDIEDIQTPNLTVINCTSENENLGVASRAYNLIVRDCNNLNVCAYGGWAVNVYNHNGIVRHNSATCNTKIYIKDSHLTNMASSPIGPNYVVDNCVVDLCYALNSIKNFYCVVDENYVKSVCVYLNGVVNGKIYETVDGWYRLGPKEGSNLELIVPDNELYCVNGVTNDSWGINTNTIVLPNGFTIHDSKFVINVQRMQALSGPSYSRPLFNGEYENCDFDIHVDEMFISKAIRFDEPIDLTFTNCNFTLDDGLVIIKGGRSEGLINGSTITYNNCTINGQKMTQEIANKITSHQTVGVIINVL